MTIEEFYAGRTYSQPPFGTPGNETEWLDFCELEFRGARILIIDADFVPAEEEGLIVTITPGVYKAQIKVMDYGGDARISRIRSVLQGSSPSDTSLIGQTWTDTGRTGFCDIEAVKNFWGEDIPCLDRYIRPFTQSENPFGVAVIDRAGNAVIPFVDSGFGDGQFPVHELLADGRRIGFEIEFIASDELYPF